MIGGNTWFELGIFCFVSRRIDPEYFARSIANIQQSLRVKNKTARDPELLCDYIQLLEIGVAQDRTVMAAGDIQLTVTGEG